MIWNDADFQRAYRAGLLRAQTSGEAEVQAQAMAFQAETARPGGSVGDRFTHRAGAAAAALLSGYVRGAIEAFERTLETVEAKLIDADVDALRASLEQEIARRSKSLPAALRDFGKPAAPPALLRAILRQAPADARHLLAERVAATRTRVSARVGVRTHEIPERAVFIGHDPRDAALADALKLTISAALGGDVVVCASDLEPLRTGSDATERMLAQLKWNRMTLSLMTPRSIGDPVLWWTLGVAEGAGKPALVLRTEGVGADFATPLRAERVIHLSKREEVLRLLRAIQAELRRRGPDFAELDLDPLLREAARC